MIEPDEHYYCESCGGTPPGWDYHEPRWLYCPQHGTRLLSDIEMGTEWEEHGADVRREEDVFARIRTGEAFGLGRAS